MAKYRKSNLAIWSHWHIQAELISRSKVDFQMEMVGWGGGENKDNFHCYGLCKIEQPIEMLKTVVALFLSKNFEMWTILR